MTLAAPAYSAQGRAPVVSLRDRLAALRGLDWPLLLAAAGLCLAGAALISSATRAGSLDSGADPQSYLKRHLLNVAIGIALGTAAAVIDHRLLRAYAPVVYLLAILGLLAVLTPLGRTINGSHSWLGLPGGLSLQPSELAKVALVVGLAMMLSEPADGRSEPRNVDVAVALLVAGIPLGLVMLQPDLGTALVIASLALGVVVVSGGPLRWVCATLGAATVAAYLAVRLQLLESYQLDRFTAFLDPGADPQGAGYNVRQAQIAIGSGGIDGQGLFQGAQTQGRFVPAQQTDFIFTVAGEELGFLGGAALLLLLGVVLWRTARIAAAAEDLFGRLVATGVLCWFAFQSFENIGMSLGILPVTGVPLPLVSYGGSSMFASLLALGLVQNIHMRRSH